LRPLHDPGDIALAVHRTRERELHLVEAEQVSAVGIHHVDEPLAAVLDGFGEQVLAKLGAIVAARDHQPPFRSSVSTSLATAFSVSNTPMPFGATASKLGTLVGFSASSSSGSGIAFGRSRLLYWTTYGNLSRSYPCSCRFERRFSSDSMFASMRSSW